MIRRKNAFLRAASAQGEEGFAMMLAVFALFTLSLLAVAALTVAGTDLRVANMTRKRTQVRFAANVGMDSARDLMRRVSTNRESMTELNNQWAFTTDCYSLKDFADLQGWATDLETTYASGGIALGRPEACLTNGVYFTGPAPGYSMETGTGSGGTAQYQMVAMDVQVTSTHSDTFGNPVSATKSQVGGIITSVCEAPCGR